MGTMAEVKAVNKANGNCWFDPKTMKFWRSKVHGGVRNGKYFITSEDNFDRTKRLFTVRSFNDSAEIDTVGEFQAYRNLDEAKHAIKQEKP